MDFELAAALERIEARLDGLWAEQRKAIEKLNRLLLASSRRENGPTNVPEEWDCET